MDQVQNFFNTSVTIKWNSTGAGNFYVGTLPTVANGYLVVNRNSPSKREIIKYTGTGTDGNGPFITVLDAGDRGLGGTTAQTHEIGETVQMTITAQHWSDLIATLDGIINDGAPTATTTVRGIVKMNTVPADPADPIVIGPNDPLLTKPTGEPTAFVTTSAGAADEGKGVLLNPLGLIDRSMIISTTVREYNTADSPATWTKPDGLKAIYVELYGAGGGGAGGSNETGTSAEYAGSGGGGGAHFFKYFVAGELGATETVTIGAGGTGGNGKGPGSTGAGFPGTAGGNTSFGTLAYAYGGGRGLSDNNNQTSGGTGGSYLAAGTDGTISGVIPAPGGAPILFPFKGNSTTTNVANLDNISFGGASSTTNGGGNSEYGGAAGGANYGRNGGSSLFAGAGGGGGGRAEAGGTGGKRGSYTAGGGAAGGADNSSLPGDSGANPGDGGGGGGANSVAVAGAGGNGNLYAGGGGGGSGRNNHGGGKGGNGGNGFVRITEFY